MNSFIFTLLFCCALLRFSFCSECSTQTVHLNSVVNSYNILSNSSDLASKTCIYTFTVPKYFVPTAVFVNVRLTEGNTITTGQSKEYGGTRIYGITKYAQLNLAPVNFTIEIDLKTKTPNDSFSILITVKDKTPATVGTNFVVRKDLGTLIDFGDVWGNSTTVQKFDVNNPQAQSYTIRVTVFSPIAATFSLMDMVYVYDNGVYKGSLLDVYTAGMNNQVCSGTKFEIVNSLSSTIGPFTILISEMHEWAEKTVTATSAPDSNSTQTLSSTNDLLVIHEISNPLLGILVPFYYQQLSIKEGTELKIYAGCVTGAQENRRIATITPSNAHNFENIEFTGRCKTFVLTRGSIQWQSFHAFPINTYRSEIGRQGVIMNTNYPYPNQDNSTRNYLIQSPSSESKENIIVTYEIASMASDVDFNIEEHTKASQITYKTLTSNDKTFTSVSTYQQYIRYKAPINSDECSTQTIDLNDVVKPIEISSNSSDLEPKKCIYTFTVPKYYVPMVMFVNIQLTGENKITTRQYSEYGGTKSYEITKTTHFNLAPTNFTIEINLKTKTVNDSFSILVSVRDKTPAIIGDFFVREDLGTLIDYFDIKGNSSSIQKFDANHSQAQSYTIRVAVFSQDPSLFSLMDMIHVYDNGVYKGSLLDVYTAANNSQICSGTIFEIVNSIDTLVGPLTILISKTHQGWDETAVLVNSATDTNATQTLSATNGLLVMHEISNPNMGSSLPVYYQQISFRGDTELTIYAGCVTGAQANRSVAIITPANAHNYENIEIYGRCKTFVLTKGYIQWQSVHNFPKDTYRSEIGRKGVIMNPTFPYPSTDNISHNYLIQSPSADSKENIVVTYEVAFMAPDVNFNIDQDIKAFQDANKTLTASDGTYTSVSTYQEFITYKVSNNSDGFLVRYTVTSSANLINLYFVVLLLMFKFL